MTSKEVDLDIENLDLEVERWTLSSKIMDLDIEILNLEVEEWILISKAIDLDIENLNLEVGRWIWTSKRMDLDIENQLPSAIASSCEVNKLKLNGHSMMYSRNSQCFFGSSLQMKNGKKERTSLLRLAFRWAKKKIVQHP